MSNINMMKLCFCKDHDLLPKFSFFSLIFCIGVVLDMNKIYCSPKIASLINATVNLFKKLYYMMSHL